MQSSRFFVVLLTVGALAFLVAGLSIVDMFVPRPFDGVYLEADTPGSLTVRQVVRSSGAARAGIHSGDTILGIDATAIRAPAEAQEILNRHRIGDSVSYLVRSDRGLHEVAVELGPRRIGDSTYLVASALGFLFFFVGVFVVLRQRHLPAAQVFFMLCTLFLLFLVCRLRPASYSWVDTFVLTTGTAALLFMPPTFLHFFLIFPRPVWESIPVRWVQRALAWPASPRRLAFLYVVPLLVYAASAMVYQRGGTGVPLISGAPLANWWLMAVYMVLGLAALATNASRLDEPRQRRGAGLVLIGAVFGIVPFLILAVAFPSFLHTERFIIYGVVPLALVPLTFAYAIVRFQLLEIRVILRKSLLYTATTAVVTALYALGIASVHVLFRGTPVVDSRYFPFILALAIVLLFEPLRHRIQGPVDRFFFAERSRLQRAMVELGEAFGAHVDLATVVRSLVERLPEILGLHFAALYLVRGQRLVRVEGPGSLPESVPILGFLHEHLRRSGGLVQVDQLGSLEAVSVELGAVKRSLEDAGVEVVGHLASPRRRIGLVMLSGKTSQMSFEPEELSLLRSLLHQAAMALETSLLLEERTRQAELEREMEIAASIQASLLPSSLTTPRGWSVAALCQPARQVGGDFYAELTGPDGQTPAIVFGDVSGKSVPGALLMMAAHEVLQSLAISYRDPEELFELANRRLYALQKRRFISLGYLHCVAGAGTLRYLIAGQPPLLHVRTSGAVEELPLSTHRIPVGAMRETGYASRVVEVETGDVVLAYSDGVIEARSPSGEFFGQARLESVLAGCQSDPQLAVHRVMEAIRDFTHGEHPYDDVTLIALARVEDEVA